MEIYTATEVLAAIKALTVQEKSRLMKIAGARARYAAFGPDDLLQEAFTRVLAGSRKWPTDVPVVPFFAQVMRGIASDWREKSESDDGDASEVGAEDHAAIARIELQKVFALFDDDPIAQKMLLALIEGVKGDDLRKLSGLSKVDYESKRTKMRRRLENHWT